MTDSDNIENEVIAFEKPKLTGDLSQNAIERGRKVKEAKPSILPNTSVGEAVSQKLPQKILPKSQQGERLSRTAVVENVPSRSKKCVPRDAGTFSVLDGLNGLLRPQDIVAKYEVQSIPTQNTKAVVSKSLRAPQVTLNRTAECKPTMKEHTPPPSIRSQAIRPSHPADDKHQKVHETNPVRDAPVVVSEKANTVRLSRPQREKPSVDESIKKLIAQRLLPSKSLFGSLPIVCFDVEDYEGSPLTKISEKVVHAPFWSKESALEGVLSGSLSMGVVRFNAQNRNEAYVTLPNLPKDVCISATNQNRCLDGDRVIIRLQPPAPHSDQMTASVVHILQRDLPYIMAGRLTASLNEYRRLHTGDNYVFFTPLESRHPIVLIPFPSVLKANLSMSTILDRLVSVSVTNWPATSPLPIGDIIKNIGAIDDIEAQTNALLINQKVQDEPFPPSVLACLPTTPWKIPLQDQESRIDLRHLDIFTIDPATARDLDDALSIEIDKSGDVLLYHVGVHIADVSYFVPSASALDVAATMRATTVYLVQRAIPMLPSLLCEQLCSLAPHEDRLAFSCFLTLNEKGEILNERFCRSIIRSCCKFHYEHVQKVLEGTPLKDLKLAIDSNVDSIEQKILLLGKLGKTLRRQRFESGALSINNVKLVFDLDNSQFPRSFVPYIQRDSNRLVEEFMLLANMAAAKRIFKWYPDRSLLRGHAGPLAHRLVTFEEIMMANNIPMDVTNAGTIQKSLNDLFESRDSDFCTAVQHLATKPMQLAKYMCSAVAKQADFFHYSLNVLLYTHFTSPIRRYADIAVHRLLQASLEQDGLAMAHEIYEIILKKKNKKITLKPSLEPLDDIEFLVVLSEHCNKKKYAAKKAQDASQLVYLCQLLSRQAKVHEMSAIVVNLSTDKFVVLLLQTGLELTFQEKDVTSNYFSLKNDVLSIYIDKEIPGLQNKLNSIKLEDRPFNEDDNPLVVSSDPSGRLIKICLSKGKGMPDEPGWLDTKVLLAELRIFDKLTVRVRANCKVTPHRLEMLDFNKV